MENSRNSTRQSQTSPRSGRSDADFVAEQLAMLAGNYPNSALSAQDLSTMKLFHEELGEMTRIHGQERVAISVRSAIRTIPRFLPEVAVLWSGIPPAPDESRWDADCPECSGSGWRYQPASQGSPRRVAKCDCYKRKARVA